MAARTRHLSAAALGVAALLAVGACGGSTSGDFQGRIVIDGSSTVAPISEAIAEEFNAEQPGVEVSVGTSGTGGGFKKFCDGEIDIADASRAIKDEEKRACAANGVEYLELRVGLDGLAIVTSAENDFVECLTLDQLAAIFKEGGATRWNEVDPSFPNEEIALFAPGTDSGTYDFFVEEVLGDVPPRRDYQASEDDNTLVQGIQGEDASWGFFGFAYYTENQDALKAIEVGETEDECTPPSDETVLSGEYPLSRPLFIYVKTSSLERRAVYEFVRFYLELTAEIIGDVGYTQAPEEDYAKGLEQLDRFEPASQ